MNSSIVLNNRKSQLARKIVHKSRVRLPPRDSRSGDVDVVNTASCRANSFLQNYSCFKSSGDVARLMYWDGYEWVDFEEKVVEFVRVCCFNTRNGVVEVETGGVLCVFDLYRMLVVEFDSGIEKSVAWIDVDGKCFFPKEFSSFREGLRKVEIEIRVSESELSNKRKREGDDEGEDEVKSVGSFLNVNGFTKRKGEDEVMSVGCFSNVIKKREVAAVEEREEVSEVESMRWKKARVMGEGRKSGLVVKNLFLNWPGIRGIGAEITGIHQVTRTSAVDKARYEAFLNQMEITKAARGEANVTFAWVKCSNDNVERMLTHGFSSPVRGFLGDAFGVGIYLSPFRSTRVR